MKGRDGTDRNVDAEDVFFAVACKRLSKSLPSRSVAVRFAAEEVLPHDIGGDSPCCFGLHKVYPYHPPEIVAALVRTSAIERRVAPAV